MTLEHFLAYHTAAKRSSFYTTDEYNAAALVMNYEYWKAWWADRDPYETLLARYWDRETNDYFHRPISGMWDDAGVWTDAFAPDWTPERMPAGTSRYLMPYFYGSHHCSCHRKQDAVDAGLTVENMDCEGDRFVIESIWLPEDPQLILFSEIHSAETLQKILLAPPIVGGDQ